MDLIKEIGGTSYISLDLYPGPTVEHGSLLLPATVAQELQAGQEVQQARRMQQQKFKVCYNCPWYCHGPAAAP